MSPQNRTHSQGHWFTISSSRTVAAKIMACCCIVASLSVLTGLVGCHGSVSSIPNINNAAEFLVDNEVYNGPSMVSPRYGHTATTLEDGTVLIVGGSDERHLTSLDLAEIFDQGAAVSLNDPVPDTGSGDFIDTDVEGNLPHCDPASQRQCFHLWRHPGRALPAGHRRFRNLRYQQS